MGLNIGSNTSYVQVRNITMHLSFSSKVVFADLVISKPTQTPKVDKETGEVVLDKNGDIVYMRSYQRYKAKFVGEGAKKAVSLADGTSIEILTGWLDKEEYDTKSGEHKSEIYCIVSDFAELSYEDYMKKGKS